MFVFDSLTNTGWIILPFLKEMKKFSKFFYI
jgi:hypothetical protein